MAIRTQHREEIADKVVTKVTTAYLEYLASFKDKNYDAYRLVTIRCSNFVLEYVELPTSDMRQGEVVYDQGRKYFEDNLVTAHVPECDGFRKDRSYRILGVDDGVLHFVDEHYVHQFSVMLDLIGDTVEVTPQYNLPKPQPVINYNFTPQDRWLSTDYVDLEGVVHTHIRWLPEAYQSYLPGWYYVDEVEMLHGPFNELLDAQRSLNAYVRLLDIECSYTTESLPEDIIEFFKKPNSENFKVVYKQGDALYDTPPEITKDAAIHHAIRLVSDNKGDVSCAVVLRTFVMKELVEIYTKRKLIEAN